MILNGSGVRKLSKLQKIFSCDEKLKRGENELVKAGLTEEKSKEVTPPKVKECFAWLECKFIEEKLVGDHVLLLGEVVAAGIKDEFVDSGGNVDIEKTKLLLHISRKDFAVADRKITAD